jgi:cyclopentanol dehydrogenase
MRLDGKVALISGGAHGVKGELMGFGGASAWMFTREGARVVLSDIDVERGEKTVSQIRESGGDAIFASLDVTSESDWAAVVRTTVDSFGKLDVLVNNAGTSERSGVEDTTEEVWDGQMAVHAKGAFLGTRAAVPEMRRAGGGSIINISSIFGLVGSPGSTAYHAAKGAVRIFTKSAAIQHAKDNIRVNSVHPGFCETPMTRGSFSDPERRSNTLSKVPMDRYGQADEVAYAILYLASDESSYVTGSEVVVDGGMTAQ